MSGLWSTLIGTADKMFVKQGTEDLKPQKKKIGLSEVLPFLNLQARDKTSISFISSPPAKKG